MQKKSAKLFIIFFILTANLFGQGETMNYKDLQNYLPRSIQGFEAGEPNGQSMSMQGMSFSSAEIEFTNDRGNYVRITLMDYIGAVSMYQAATALWAADMSFEDDEKIAGSFNFSLNIVGWEEYEKKDKNASIALGIGDRFFLSIEADNQTNTDFVKSVAEKMDLETLANKSQ